MTTEAIDRGEWWRLYAQWQLGKIEGPLCVRCGTTIPKEKVIPFCLCDECLEHEKGE